jgi:hypothetical protein
MFKKTHEAPVDLTTEIKSLIHKLDLAVSEEGGGVIVTFIAARSGEGTTTVARSFVQAYSAETGKKALLIEGSAEINVAGQGIVELAAAGADIASVLRPMGSGVVAGKWTASPGGKTHAGRILHDKTFWQSLQHNFDLIVIDAPSLQASSESIAFAQISGLTVLVVEAEATRKEVVENLRATLAAVNAKIAGIVMNKREFYIPEKVYKKL